MTTNDDVRRDDVRTKPKKLIGVLALALAASACTSDGSDATPDSLPATETTTSASGTTADDETTETSATPASTATTAAASATTATTAAKSPSTTTTTANVGGPFDIGPAAGSTMDVVGVAYDDVLNFRSDHDASSSIVDTAAPFSTSPAIVSSGAGWLLPSSAWWNVTVDGVNAWANFRYLGVLGNDRDIFADLQTDMASLQAADVDTLATNIGAARSGGPVPDVVFSSEPVAVDAQGGEAIIDVIGLGDDAVKGERIVITYRFVFDDVSLPNPTVIAVELMSANATAICGRGATGTGACL